MKGLRVVYLLGRAPALVLIETQLSDHSDELAQLKMYFTSNTHTMNDIRNTLRENAEQLVVLGEAASLHAVS